METNQESPMGRYISTNRVCSWMFNEASRAEQKKLFGLRLYEIKGDGEFYFSVVDLQNLLTPENLRGMECVINQRMVELSDVYISDKINRIDFDDKDKFMLLENLFDWVANNVASENRNWNKREIRNLYQYENKSGDIFVLREDVRKVFNNDDYFKMVCCGVSTMIIKIKDLKKI